MRIYAPDAVWDASDGLGVFEGAGAIRRLFEDWRTAYEDLEVKPEEILDLGGGVVLTRVLQMGRLVGSKGQVQAREAWVSEWKEGVIVRMTSYRDNDEARAAAERLAEERV